MPKTNVPDLLQHFVACDEGQQFLSGIRDHLNGQTIVGVNFLNNGGGITTILSLRNGQSYNFNDDELCLETLSEQFSGLFRELARNNSKQTHVYHQEHPGKERVQ